MLDVIQFCLLQGTEAKKGGMELPVDQTAAFDQSL